MAGYKVIAGASTVYGDVMSQLAASMGMLLVCKEQVYMYTILLSTMSLRSLH